MTERRKNQSEEWTYFTLLFIYFITVNKYRFCISVIRYINVQIIGIGYKKINIGRSLLKIFSNVIYSCDGKAEFPASLLQSSVQLITCDCHSHLVTKAGSVIMNSILHSLSVIYGSVY